MAVVSACRGVPLDATAVRFCFYAVDDTREQASGGIVIVNDRIVSKTGMRPRNEDGLAVSVVACRPSAEHDAIFILDDFGSRSAHCIVAIACGPTIAIGRRRQFAASIVRKSRDDVRIGSSSICGLLG